ncbi:MAG: hypothetical protein FWC39_08620 [Bacteroidetes bacterium]|nr:hypothetical protein [Bacteroidota bacterium]
MKRLHFLAIVALGAAVMSSCGPKPDDCINCTGQGIIKTTYLIDTAIGSITVYPVLTPRNYDFCDSFVYKNGAFMEPYRVHPKLLLCTKEAARDTARRYRESPALNAADQPCVCRINPDKKFNDSDGKPKNDILFIEGIEKFPNSVMYLRTPGDTTKIRTYFNYNNHDDPFNGLILRHKNTRVIESKMLKSGIYEAELMFFKDAAQQVPLGNAIKFRIAIIRSNKVCNITCLKQARDQDDTELLN